MPKGIFNKALLQIFMVLMIIIAVMFVSDYYIYKNSMDAMFEQAEMNNRLVVRGIIQSFEESFKEINSIIYTVGTLPYRVYDPDGYKNIDIKNAYLLTQNVRQLISQDYIHDFIIFFRDSDLALTLSGTESFTEVFSKKYKNSKFSPEYWKNFAATSHPMQIIPSNRYFDGWSSGEKAERNLLAIVASNQLSNSPANIVVFVDLARLYRKVNEESMMQGASLIVLDKDKNVIISTDEDYSIEGLESNFFDSGSGATFQKGKYNYNWVKSEYNSFIYINKVPNRYEDVISTVKINKRILLVTTIAGLFISLILSMYIYRPVKKLLRLVGIKDEEKRQNHYKHIFNSIEKMQLENKLISNRMDNVKEEVMRSIFFKMIDDITFYKDMKDQVDIYFKVIFSSWQYLMLAFDLGQGIPAPENPEHYRPLFLPEDIKTGIQKSLEQIKNVSVVVIHLENMQLIALVGVEEPTKREALLRDIKAVRDQLQSTLLSDYQVLVAVSGYYSEARSCKEAFENIKMYFAYRSITNTKTLIDLEKNEYVYDVHMPLDFDEKLSNYMLSGNAEESFRLVRQVIKTNEENNISYIKFHNILTGIFNNMINILVYLKADRDEIFYYEKEFRSITNNHCHPAEITGFFKDLIEQATDRVRGGNQNKLNKDFVLRYVQLHYAENLYLDKMAEVFNTSSKYFSNFFKRTFGINFVDFLNKERIHHAKELLKHSEIPVSTIGQKVGYLSSSTFASTFRKYCGITPSEYRKEYRNGK